MKNKFVIFISLMTLTVLVVALACTLALTTRLFRRSSEESLDQAALLGRQEISTWLRTREEWLLDIQEELQQFSMDDEQGIEAKMASYHNVYPEIDQVFIGTSDNRFYSSIFWRPEEEGYDCRTRDWYVNTVTGQGVTCTTYNDGTTGLIVLSLTVPVRDADHRDMGVLGIDFNMDTLLQMVDQSSIMDTSGKAFLLDANENYLTHVNPAFHPRSTLDGGEVYTSFTASGIVLGNNISERGIYLGRGTDWDGTKVYIATCTLEENGWTYGFAVPVSDYYGMYYSLAAGFAVIIAVMVVVSVIFASMISRKLLVPIHTIIDAAGEMAAGNYQVDVNIRTGDELEELARKFRQLARSTTRQIEVMKAMEQGDFTKSVEPKSQRDILSQTINSVSLHLRELVVQIIMCANQVAEGSSQMERTSALLAQGVVEQNSSMEELGGHQQQMLASIQHNAELARRARETMMSVREQAERGRDEMDHMVHAVQEIEQTASGITEIIKVIDDIAMQTNLLALNASVEAAKAREHGKGFAVVADEVRRLALKSAQAAESTANLVQIASAKSGDGVDIAHRIRDAFRGIAGDIDHVADMVQEIDRITDDQELGIKGISDSVAHIADVAQKNSVTAEESAASSVQINEQAQILKTATSAFRIDSAGTRPSAHAAGMALREHSHGSQGD